MLSAFRLNFLSRSIKGGLRCQRMKIHSVDAGHASKGSSSGSSGLSSYLQGLVAHNLESWGGSDADKMKASKYLIEDVMDEISLKEDTSKKRLRLDRGTQLAKSCKSMGLDNPAVNVREILDKAEGFDGVSLIGYYINKLAKDHAVFCDISTHHQSLGNSKSKSENGKEWNKVIESSMSLPSYARAATEMGLKGWVRDSNQWMQDFALSFFRKNGARRDYIRHMEATSTSSSSFEKGTSSTSTSWDELGLKRDLMVDKKIRLLDVGSCYNPLASGASASAFDITALDLYPSNSTSNSHSHSKSHPHDGDTETAISNDVMQCDFLALDIGDEKSAQVTRLVPAGVTARARDKKETESEAKSAEWTQLLELPAHSYDCVTMSLVLSYLPKPSQRISMIQKARKLLKNPPPSLSSTSSISTNSTSSTDAKDPHYSGLLLIVEKESIFGKDKELTMGLAQQPPDLLKQWKTAISGEGFRLVKYRRLVHKDENANTNNNNKGKVTYSHAFAFRTTDTSPDENENSPVVLDKEQRSRRSSCSSRFTGTFAGASEAATQDDGDSTDEDLLKNVQRLQLRDQKKQQIIQLQQSQNDKFNSVNSNNSEEGRSGAEGGLWIRQDFKSTSSARAMEVLEEEEANEEKEFSLDTQTANNQNKNKNKNNKKKNEPLPWGPLPVGIVGGGLGGAALALSLQNRGIPVRLFEKDESFLHRRQGYALTLQQAVRAIETMGIDVRAEAGVASLSHVSLDSNGGVLGKYGHSDRDDIDRGDIDRGEKVNENEKGKEKKGKVTSTSTSTSMVAAHTQKRHNVHVPRQKIRGLLLEKLNNGIVEWNKELEGFSYQYQQGEQDGQDESVVDISADNLSSSSSQSRSPNSHNSHPTGVCLRFSDGTTSSVSALIGADGIFSKVRHLLETSKTDNQLTNNSTNTCTSNSNNTSTSSTSSTSNSGLKYLGLMVVLGISPLPSATKSWDLSQQQTQWLDAHTRVFSMPFGDGKNVMWQLSYPMEESEALEISSRNSKQERKSAGNSKSKSEYLCTVGILCNVEWCVRQLWCSLIILYNTTSMVHNHHTDNYPILFN